MSSLPIYAEKKHADNGTVRRLNGRGMILRAYRLLQENSNPTEEEIRFGISGNLCRCTGYQNIVKAIQYAAAKLVEGPLQEAAE